MGKKIKLLIAASLIFSGVVLAGAGVAPVKADFFSLFKSKKKYENLQMAQYWSDTGLKLADLQQLVSNSLCKTSDLYFIACTNAIINGALQAQVRLLENKLVSISVSDPVYEKTEKEILTEALKSNQKIDFDSVIQSLYLKIDNFEKSSFIAKTINSFLSVYYDPHTYIMPTQFFEDNNLSNERSKSFVGITYEKQKGALFIRKVIKNSDADMAGLKTNDIVESINEYEIKKSTLSEISEIFKDAEIKTLSFSVLRNKKRINIDLKRSYRTLGYVSSESLPNGTLSVSLAKFNRGVCKEIKSLLKNSRERKGLILDLRDNPGGLLDEAACIAGLFLGAEKKAYFVQYFNESRSSELALTGQNKVYNGKMVVLVNSTSASSAEVLAGILQSHKRAVILGQRTFGKGSFQEPETWGRNKKISLLRTQGYYLLPNKNSAQLKGVRPDVVVLDKSEENVRREESIYFRPLPPLKAHDLTNNENKNFPTCVSKSNLNLEDPYLNKGLEYLNCTEETLALRALPQAPNIF